VVRRAERQAWAAIAAYGDQPGTGTRGEGGVNVLTARYLNRLSDLLFVLARVANLPIGGDVLWQPGGGRATAPGDKHDQNDEHDQNAQRDEAPDTHEAPEREA
jgi:cob(I)alamin adenosyltransferase